MNVVVDGLLTNYVISGEGKNYALLLHGWGDSRKTFNHIDKFLKDEYKLVSLDLPGFGQTQAPKEVWGLDNYVNFLANFLEKLKIKKVDLIIGHSNGGALAIKAVASNKISPDSLVLLSSAGIRDRQKGKKLAIKAIAKTGKVATFWLPKNYKQNLQKKLYGTVGSDMLVVPELKETFKRTVSEDVQNQARKIKIPTLLIYGSNDKATPLQYGEIYKKLITNSHLEIIKNASHFAHQEYPEKIANMIKGFLK